VRRPHRGAGVADFLGSRPASGGEIMTERTGTALKRASISCLLLLIAAAPAYAGSGKIRHSGAVVDVPESKVTLRITIKKGRPTKLSAFRATGVPTRCETGEFLFEFKSLNPTRITRKGNFKEALKNPDGSKLKISGTVRRRGKRVSGFIRTNEFDGNGMICRVPKQKFRTEKARP
jgi:hypothetical protein